MGIRGHSQRFHRISSKTVIIVLLLAFVYNKENGAVANVRLLFVEMEPFLFLIGPNN